MTGHHRNGVPIRVPRKREDEAELATYVWQLFDEMPSLHSVGRRVNQEGRLRPMRRKLGFRTWDANDLTRMLRNTIYFGALTRGVRREQASRTGELSDVLDEFEPTTPHCKPAPAGWCASVPGLREPAYRSGPVGI
ncbi:MAG: recombinase family protein [Chloroflexi bacterium]|nr:recombinase family protein [Chloroflexota bacterium]MBV9898879.1 recombinase family protein [Chloroflexota bacterium]